MYGDWLLSVEYYDLFNSFGVNCSRDIQGEIGNKSLAWFFSVRQEKKQKTRWEINESTTWLIKNKVSSDLKDCSLHLSKWHQVLKSVHHSYKLKDNKIKTDMNIRTTEISSTQYIWIVWKVNRFSSCVQWLLGPVILINWKQAFCQNM